MIAPTAEAPASAEPEMAPNNMLASTLVWASAPGIGPVIALASPINLDAMPPWFMMAPARTNSGMASSAKESMPL